MVVYTHLGKRPASKYSTRFHIPKKTKDCLKYISEKYNEQILMISSVSLMFDYLILRDNIKIYQKKNIIEFNPDGIRYKNIKQSDLKGKKFSFEFSNLFDLNNIKVLSAQKNLKFDLIIECKDKIFSIKF